MIEFPIQATSQHELLAQILDLNEPKSEREWAARREILRLRQVLANQQAPITPTPPWIGA